MISETAPCEDRLGAVEHGPDRTVCDSDVRTAFSRLQARVVAFSGWMMPSEAGRDKVANGMN